MVGRKSGGWEKVTREVRSEMDMVEAGRESGGEVSSCVTDDTQEGQCKLPVALR